MPIPSSVPVVSSPIDPLKAVIEAPDGFGAWFEGFGKIKLNAPRVGDDGRITSMASPVANYMQYEFVRLVEFCLVHQLPIRVILLKPRQKGCSTISVAFLYWIVRRLALEGMIIGGILEQTGELWKILGRYAEYDAYPWESTAEVNEARARINGSIINKRTAKNENAGRGGTYHAVIVTELGRWEEGGKASAGDVLQGVQSTVADLPNTAIILESTARGNTGVFHEQWNRAISPEDFYAGNYGPEIPYVRLFAPSHAFPDSRLPLKPHEADALNASLTDDERSRMTQYGAPLEYIAWRRHILKNKCRGNLTRMKFDYPDSPQEAFHASSYTLFSDVALTKMRDAVKDGSHGVLRQVTEEDPLVWDFEDREPERSEVVIWDRPKPGLKYLIVVDPMSGVASDSDGRNRDHHAMLVLRAGYLDERGWYPMKIVARSRPPTSDPEWNCQWGILKLEDIVYGMHRYYGGCKVVVEANKDGGLLRGLWERGCYLYERDKTDDRGGEVIDATSTEKLGFLTVGGRHAENTRTAILERLEDAVARYGEDGDGLDIPDARTLDEMAVFIQNLKGRYEAAPGEHDDSVMALAIGHHLIGQATKYELPKVTRALPWELARLNKRGRAKASVS